MPRWKATKGLTYLWAVRGTGTWSNGTSYPIEKGPFFNKGGATRARSDLIRWGTKPEDLDIIKAPIGEWEVHGD